MVITQKTDITQRLNELKEPTLELNVPINDFNVIRSLRLGLDYDFCNKDEYSRKRHEYVMQITEMMRNTYN